MRKNNILPFIKVITADDGKPPKKIQVLPMGLWEAPYLPSHVKNEQDQLEINASDIDEIIGNFDADVRKGVPIDIEHSGAEAAGWITSLERVGNFLEATVEWTKLGLDKIKAKQFKFFSPEFSPNYKDPQTGEKKGWVLIGGGLVNRPLFKELAPVTAKEDLTDDGGSMILLSQTQNNSHMTKELKAILAKDKAELTDEDKALIRANEAELSDEQKVEYKEVIKADDTDEDVDNSDEDTDTDEDKDVDNSDDDEDEDEEDEDEEDEDETVEGKEKTVSIKASELKELQVNAGQGVKAFEELRGIKAKEKADKYIVGSEKGRVLEAGRKDLTALILSFDKDQTKLFKGVMENIPDAAMFKEIGKDESTTVGTSTQKFENVIQKVMADDSLPYKEAMNKAKLANPEMYKAYNKEMTK